MLLSIEELDISYRSEGGEVTSAAKDVTLQLDRGEILGLVGESGSGKSSVAMSVARLLPSPPAFYPKGRILFDGCDMLKLPLRELRLIRGKKIGVIFQDPMGSLSPLHRIGEQLIEGLLLHEKMGKKCAEEIALEWLNKVGLPNPVQTARAYPHELSGGMQQRVMIAMALMHNPDLIIADEPTTALDVTIQAQILNLLRKLHCAKSAVLLITHDLGVVSQMATRLAVMKDGCIVEQSSDVSKFFVNPQHPYSQSLVREAKRMELEI